MSTGGAVQVDLRRDLHSWGWELGADGQTGGPQLAELLQLSQGPEHFLWRTQPSPASIQELPISLFPAEASQSCSQLSLSSTLCPPHPWAALTDQLPRSTRSSEWSLPPTTPPVWRPSPAVLGSPSMWEQALRFQVLITSHLPGGGSS